MGVLRARLAADGVVTVEQFAPSFGLPVGAARLAGVLDALGCGEDALARPARVLPVSVSRPKLLIDVSGPGVLHGLVPVPGRVREVCEEHRVTGLYPFARAAPGRHSPGNSRRTADIRRTPPPGWRPARSGRYSSGTARTAPTGSTPGGCTRARRWAVPV